MRKRFHFQREMALNVKYNIIYNILIDNVQEFGPMFS